MKCGATVAALVVAAGLAPATVAQELTEAPLAIARLQSPVTVDGRLDDAAWAPVTPLPLTMYSPVFRGQPTQRTEIRVAYDDDHLYVGGWFYDRDPDNIRVNSLYRDRWNGDDTLAVYIDAFNDNQNAKWFGVTPAGIRFDQLVSDDGNTTNDNWDSFWSAATTITREGWFVEVAIPFSSLGFQADADGRAVMGLIVTRLVSRLDERVVFPAIDPSFSFRRPSLAQDIVLQGVRSRNPVYVTPYVLGAATARPGIESGTLSAKEAGLDVRYPVTGNLTLDLTLNTDFAQAEADEQQVALDRFPLFYPERRRFFQEGAGLFDFVTTNGLRLFHSRRIGLTSDFEPVRVLGGARLVGKIGSWDVGLLDMQTARETPEPSGAGGPTAEHGGENFGVLRVRRQVLNPSSNAGLMLTTFAGGGRTNVALGADTLLRVRGDDYVGLKWATTIDDRRAGPLRERSLFDVSWQRRTGRGLAYNWQFARVGDEYAPEIGFTPRRGFASVNVNANWYVFTDTHKYFRRVYPGALAFSTFRNGDGRLESGQYAFWVQWDTKSGGGGWLEPKWFREDVLVPFTIGGTATVPAGRYDFADFQAVYMMPGGDRLRTTVDFRTGTYFDGTRMQLIASPTWNASRHLELGAGYQLTRLRFERRNQQADIHLVRVRVRTAMNARASANALIQYNSTSSRVDLNLRFRYAASEGTDFWVVYNEGLDTDRATRPELGLEPLSFGRALIVKYTKTFIF